MSLENDVCTALEMVFTLRERDLGDDACLKKHGLTFLTRAWDIEGVGNLCTMCMSAPLGLMRMESAIIAPTDVDIPLFNIDWVGAMGVSTQVIELYDTQLEAWPHAWRDEFWQLLARDEDLPNTPITDEHWYDEVLYDCSYHKRGRNLDARLCEAARDYVAMYVAQLEAALPCDHAQKAQKVEAFARRLFAEGGPAVETVTSLFGPEVAQRLVLSYMYGVDVA